MNQHRIVRADGRGFDYPGRKKLLWDGKNMKATNFDEANQFVQRKHLVDWTLWMLFLI
jgi:hypothetical protein